MSQPLVTIVTPSLNQGEFIRATIESVLAQEYPSIEYLIMDGGSTDRTASIAAEYSTRLVWTSDKDRGQSHAINKGFLRARGDIVAWLNSDDLLLPGAVAAAVRALQQAEPAGAVYGEGYLTDRSGLSRRRFPATDRFNLWKLTYLSDYILQPAAFFRRAALETVGWLDESLHYAMDWDLLIRLGKKFGLAYTPEYLAALREYPEAKSFSGGRARVAEIRRVLERHTGLRRAPGYWTHALDQLQHSGMAALSGPSPGWLAPPAQFLSLLVYVATAAPIAWVARRSQGCFPDGWVGRRLRWMLPEGQGKVAIRGFVPDRSSLRGQTLAAWLEGRQLARWPLGPGSFEVTFELRSSPGTALQFEVRASHWCHAPLHGELGLRRLAWKIESIRSEPA
ncbi:MAG: glycosyltransferase family 2 protein [Bryobacteraceae bacterium]